MGTIAFVCMVGLQSCGGGGILNNTPGATVKKAFNLMAEKNYEKVIQMYTKKDGTAFTEEENGKLVGLMNMASAEITKKEGIKSVDIIEEKIAEDGKTATVKWKITYGNGETDDSDGELIKVGNDWKLVVGN